MDWWFNHGQLFINFYLTNNISNVTFFQFSFQSYANWAPGEPSETWNGEAEDCVNVYNTGKWNDDSCGEKFPFVCRHPRPRVSFYNQSWVHCNYCIAILNCNKLHSQRKMTSIFLVKLHWDPRTWKNSMWLSWYKWIGLYARFKMLLQWCRYCWH